MNLVHKILGKCLLAAVLLIAANSVAAATSKNEARVTRVIRDVKLLAPEAAAKPAAVNDNVREDTAVRTGNESRSELTFVDHRITRLGENTIFTFNRAGRNIRLDNGALLFYGPKNSGGAQMTTSAVSVAITGTTVILQSNRSGRNNLSVLEGDARISLNKYPRESAYVRAGQMMDVPPGATKLPPPVNIDVRKAMKSSLIAGFPPLPSQPLIMAVPNPPAYPSQPTVRHPAQHPPSYPQPVRGHSAHGGPIFVPVRHPSRPHWPKNHGSEHPGRGEHHGGAKHQPEHPGRIQHQGGGKRRPEHPTPPPRKKTRKHSPHRQ